MPSVSKRVAAVATRETISLASSIREPFSSKAADSTFSQRCELTSLERPRLPAPVERIDLWEKKRTHPSNRNRRRGRPCRTTPTWRGPSRSPSGCSTARRSEATRPTGRSAPRAVRASRAGRTLGFSVRGRRATGSAEIGTVRSLIESIEPPAYLVHDGLLQDLRDHLLVPSRSAGGGTRLLRLAVTLLPVGCGRAARQVSLAES